jgi:hypothetical protein
MRDDALLSIQKVQPHVVATHVSLNDETFLNAFASGALDPVQFTHEAHLRLAWLHLRLYDRDAAIRNVTEQIRHYDQRHGKGDKYHCTLTVAAMLLLEGMMKRSAAEDFPSFLGHHPELVHEFGKLILRHYSPDRLASLAARWEFLEPDLLPFDEN